MEGNDFDMQNHEISIESKNEYTESRRRKRYLWGFGIFLGFMFVCMLISKSIYASQLPIVSVKTPESKYIEHIVTAEGITVEGSNRAVNALAGTRVESIQVSVGDRVEEGDVLFKIDLEDLNTLMEERQAEIDKLSLQIAAIVENEELARQKKELESARAKEDYDKTAQEEGTDVGRALQAYVEAEEALEDHNNSPWDESWEAEQEALEKALQQAAYAESDARRERDHAMTQAQREIEDNAMPEEADSALEVYRLELSEQQKQLALYQAVADGQGEITAKAAGVVTAIQIEAGARVPDAAVMLLSDENVPCRFSVMLSKEQKKYVKLGDTVTIKLDGGREVDATVDYLAQSMAAPDSFEAYVTLPQGTGTPGLSGTLSRSESGERRGICLPTYAVYTEENRSFVYVLREREGILGMEYYVDEVPVKILDQNEEWTALQEGAVDKESNIIVSATKEIEKGQTVRKEL